MRFLFIIRGESDFERFVAIASHLNSHDLTFAIIDSSIVLADGLHHKLLRKFGYKIENFSQQINYKNCSSKVLIERLIKLLFDVQPDVLVIDQFGYTCIHPIVEIRNIAMRLNITTCMIPHGVRNLDIQECGIEKIRNSDYSNTKKADIIFYTNNTHLLQAASYYNVPQTHYAVLGDPRFDLAHLENLLSLIPIQKEKKVASSKRKLAYFESNYNKGLLKTLKKSLGLETLNEINNLVLDVVEANSSYITRIKPHPRLEDWKTIREDTQYFSVDSIILSSWADIVATSTSSIILEALILGKKAIILDTKYLAPNYINIFEELNTSSRINDKSISLTEVYGNDLFFNKYCWAGHGAKSVSRIYAKRLVSIAKGDMSNLQYVS